MKQYPTFRKIGSIASFIAFFLYVMTAIDEANLIYFFMGLICLINGLFLFGSLVKKKRHIFR